MKNRAVLILCALVLLIIPLTSCAVDDTATQQTNTILTDINGLKTWKSAVDVAAGSNAAQWITNTGTQVNQSKTDIAAIKTWQTTTDQKLATISSPTLTNYYTKAEVDAAITAAINAYKATLPSNQQPQQSTTTPTGTISYTIQNPAAMGLYQLQTATNISIRIFNNKADARYVRPQITLTSYNGVNSGTVTATATVISNSMGQAAVVFSANPIPVGATTQVLFIAASGGVLNGQYLLASGNAMDILVTIQSTGTLSSLWNLSVTGSDVSSTTGL